jgi:hypothetical protein
MGARDRNTFYLFCIASPLSGETLSTSMLLMLLMLELLLAVW